MRLAFVLMTLLAACGPTSSIPSPTDASTTSADCPRTSIGRVELDGGMCVYTCPAATYCPGIGCIATDGDPRHCGACGNACGPNEVCDRATGSTTWACRLGP